MDPNQPYASTNQSPYSAYSPNYSDHAESSRESHSVRYSPYLQPTSPAPDRPSTFCRVPPSPISPPLPYSLYPQISSYTSSPHQSYSSQSRQTALYDGHSSQYERPNGERSSQEGPRQQHFQSYDDRQTIASFDRGQGHHERIPSFERTNSVSSDGWAGGERSWQDRERSTAMESGLPTPSYTSTYISPPAGIYERPDGYFAPRGVSRRPEYEIGSPHETDGSYDGGDVEKSDSTTVSAGLVEFLSL
ncbi:hypothetical protein P7C70_g6247, partial [Phenoliferia sp. Uapishka_3]